MDMKATFAVVNYTSSNFSTKGIIDVPFMCQIRRLGVRFFEVDSVFHKNCTAGCVHSVRTRLTLFKESRVDLEKSQPRTSDST